MSSGTQGLPHYGKLLAGHRDGNQQELWTDEAIENAMAELMGEIEAHLEFTATIEKWGGDASAQG